MKPGPDWLSLTDEKTIDPLLTICDPHHHLWSNRPKSLPTTYLLDQFLSDIHTGEHNIVSSVFIECGTMFNTDGPVGLRPVGETQFANDVANMSASGLYGPTRVAAGIVGTAFLSAGDSVASVLDAQLSAGGDRFKGIRQAAARNDDPLVPDHRTSPRKGLYTDKMFRAGFAHLAPRNLSFEGWCYHPQIPELTELASAFPDTTIILAHFGGPLGVGPYADSPDDVFAEWCKVIRPLSERPNVYAKLGGLNMEINGFDWHTRSKPPGSDELLTATRRYYDHTIDLFGTDRCMFESNFPVDRISCSYNVLWNTFKKLTAAYSTSEKLQLFHDTAVTVYRLNAPNSAHTKTHESSSALNPSGGV